ncbi:hypothetical protein V1506DRAFT_545099 [Lipomyces tetrasporus]
MYSKKDQSPNLNTRRQQTNCYERRRAERKRQGSHALPCGSSRIGQGRWLLTKSNTERSGERSAKTSTKGAENGTRREKTREAVRKGTELEKNRNTKRKCPETRKPKQNERSRRDDNTLESLPYPAVPGAAYDIFHFCTFPPKASTFSQNPTLELCSMRIHEVIVFLCISSHRLIQPSESTPENPPASKQRRCRQRGQTPPFMFCQAAPFVF